MKTSKPLQHLILANNLFSQYMKGVLLLLALPFWALGQSSPGSIEGYVKDSNGEALIGVTVVAVEQNTNLTRGAVTDVDGNYRILALPRGTYNITASYIGFQSVEKQDITIAIGQILRLDFELASGGIDISEVLIIGRAEAVEMRQTSVATPISREQIEYLPVFSRNILSLGQLAPGARSFDGQAADFSSGSSQPGVQSATGAVFGQYMIDGLNTKGRTAGSSVTGNVNDVWLSQLAVEEMRFITNGYDAQYEGGTEVTVVETKRGTNNLEVQAFVNGYQDWMRAQGALEVEKPKDFSRYQSGAFMSGPIIKDRLFFAASYERNDEVQPVAFAIPDDPEFQQYDRLINNDVGYTLWSAKLTAQINSGNTFDLAWFARRDDHNVVLPGANTAEWGWTQDQVTDIFSARLRTSSGKELPMS